jgi:hypothetical protein
MTITLQRINTRPGFTEYFWQTGYVFDVPSTEFVHGPESLEGQILVDPRTGLVHCGENLKVVAINGLDVEMVDGEIVWLRAPA